MRVFNREKTQEITEYDLSYGYLTGDRIFTAHHEATEKIPGKTVKEIAEELEAEGKKTEVINGELYLIKTVFENGGKYAEKICPIPETPGKEAWDEYEDILVYIPYTAEELEEKARAEYERKTDRLIRKRYTLSQELSLLRQQQEKPEEYAEYFAYCEACKRAAKAEIYGGEKSGADKT